MLENEKSTNEIKEIKSVGEILRLAREDADIAISKVVEDLRIKQLYVEAIESCSYEKLPGIPYAIGFIRSYANYLGFDGEEAILLFKNEASELPNKKNTIAAQEPLSENSLSKKYIVILGILIIAVCIIVWQRASDLNREAATTIPAIDEYANDRTTESTINAPSDMTEIANVKNVQTITIENDGDEQSKTIKVVEIENNSGTMSVISENIATAESYEHQDDAINIDQTLMEEEIKTAEEQQVPEEIAEKPPEKPEGMSDASFKLAMQIFMVPARKPSKEKLLESFKTIPITEKNIDETVNQPVPNTSDYNSSNVIDGSYSNHSDSDAQKIKIYGMDNIGTRTVITAKDTAFVSVYRSGKEVFAKKLNDGDKFFTPIPNGNRISMTTDNAGAIDIIVDDNIHIYPGKNGQAINDFSLNITDLKNFLENQPSEKNKTEINYTPSSIDRR